MPNNTSSRQGPRHPSDRWGTRLRRSGSGIGTGLSNPTAPASQASRGRAALISVGSASLPDPCSLGGRCSPVQPPLISPPGRHLLTTTTETRFQTHLASSVLKEGFPLRQSSSPASASFLNPRLQPLVPQGCPDRFPGPSGHFREHRVWASASHLAQKAELGTQVPPGLRALLCSAACSLHMVSLPPWATGVWGHPLTTP